MSEAVQFREASALEDLIAVVFHEKGFALAHGRNPEIVGEAPRLPSSGCRAVGVHDASVDGKADQASIEQPVNVGRQQKAIVWIQPFLVVCYTPWLDVTGREQRRAAYAGDATRRLATLENVGSKLSVAQPSKHKLALRCLRQWRTANFLFNLIFRARLKRIGQQGTTAQVCALNELKQPFGELFGDRGEIAALIAMAVFGANGRVLLGQQIADLGYLVARREPGLKRGPCDRYIHAVCVPVLGAFRLELRPLSRCGLRSCQAHRADVLLGIREDHVSFRHEVQVVPRLFAMTSLGSGRGLNEATFRFGFECHVVVHPPVPHFDLLQGMWARVCPRRLRAVSGPGDSELEQEKGGA
jgi:hypothetical protein